MADRASPPDEPNDDVASPGDAPAREGRARAPTLDELWSAVLGSWTDEPAHAAFLEQCRVTRQLDVAARRYREQAQQKDPYRDDPSHIELAKKRLQAVATLAFLELQSSAAKRGETARFEARRSVFRWGFIVFVILGLLAVALRHR